MGVVWYANRAELSPHFFDFSSEYVYHTLLKLFVALNIELSALAAITYVSERHMRQLALKHLYVQCNRRMDGVKWETVHAQIAHIECVMSGFAHAAFVIPRHRLQTGRYLASATKLHS